MYSLHFSLKSNLEFSLKKLIILLTSLYIFTFFSLLGRNIVTGQFDFIYEILTIWFVILIISFLTCLIPGIKVYKQNIRNTLLNS